MAKSLTTPEATESHIMPKAKLRIMADAAEAVEDAEAAEDAEDTDDAEDAAKVPNIKVLNNTCHPIYFAVGITRTRDIANSQYHVLDAWKLSRRFRRVGEGATVYVVRGDLNAQNDFEPEIHFIPLKRILVIT